MIFIEITETEVSQKIEIKGHSDKGKEPCARVTSAFEMFVNLLYKDRDYLEQKDGYSLIVTNVTPENKNQLEMAKRYFNSLILHYPRTIKIENRKV